MMKTAVSGSPKQGFSVAKVEGYGRIDSGMPTFWGTKIAEGFATSQEAFAWAKAWELEQAS